MKPKYIYDVKSSRLYDMNGFFLKQLSCPKAKRWNQLIADDPLDRSRGCQDCRERVINLDTATFIPLTLITNDSCVFIPAESSSVIILDDPEEIPQTSDPECNEDGLLIIKTARTIESINRAASMGYWPDVRLIDYKDKPVNDDDHPHLKAILFDEPQFTASTALTSKFSVGQNTRTGRIDISGDYRFGFGSKHSEHEVPEFLLGVETGEIENNRNEAPADTYSEVIPFTNYYPNYQRLPIAAYLIPPDLKEGVRVVVEDPIEDIIGSTWNQGDVSRAYDVKGWVRDKKIVIDYESVERSSYIG